MWMTFENKSRALVWYGICSVPISVLFFYLNVLVAIVLGDPMIGARHLGEGTQAAYGMVLNILGWFIFAPPVIVIICAIVALVMRNQTGRDMSVVWYTLHGIHTLNIAHAVFGIVATWP